MAITGFARFFQLMEVFQPLLIGTAPGNFERVQRVHPQHHHLAVFQNQRPGGSAVHTPLQEPTTCGMITCAAPVE